MSKKTKKILIFVADEYEDLELLYPYYRLQEEGYEVIVAGEIKGHAYQSKHKYPIKADIEFAKVKVKDYAALIIPGGYAPDKMRKIPKTISLTKDFYSAGKLVAFICHAGWIPASAGILKGHRCTSTKTIRDDITNAGGKWQDAPVIVDQNLISSRSPDDLPYFCPAIIKFLKNQIS